MKNQRLYLSIHCISTIIIALFLFQTTLINSNFVILSCREVDGIYWLIADYSIECWEGDHYFIAIYVAVPGICLWCIMFPAAIYVKMYSVRHKMGKLDVKIVYGFLYNGYKQNYWFWELIQLYRKMLIRGISIALASFSQTTQGLSALFVLNVMTMLQLACSPYEKKAVNRLELCSLLTTTFTMLGGMYFTAGLGSDVEGVISWLILTINISFVLYWIYSLYCASKDKLQTLIRRASAFGLEV